MGIHFDLCKMSFLNLEMIVFINNRDSRVGFIVTYSKPYLNSIQSVNFWISVGVAKYSPCPRLLKQNVFEILQMTMKVWRGRKRIYPIKFNAYQEYQHRSLVNLYKFFNIAFMLKFYWFTHAAFIRWATKFCMKRKCLISIEYACSNSLVDLGSTLLQEL